MDSKDFILQIDDAFSESSCQQITNLCGGIRNKSFPRENGGQYQEISVRHEFPDILEPISNSVASHLEQYEEKFKKFGEFLPEDICLEEFNVRCYDSSTRDHHNLHVDTYDADTSSRILTFIYFLNEDFTGGATIFPEHDSIITPKTGSVIIFPSNWQYPYKEAPVRTGKKYTMKTHLTYDYGED